MPNFKIDIKTSGEEKLKKIVNNIDQVSEGFDDVNINIEKYNKIIDEASKKSIAAAQSTLALKNAKLQEKIAEEALLKSKLESVKTDKLKEALEAKLAKNSADQIKLNSDVAKSQSKLVEEELKRSKAISDAQKSKAKIEADQLKQISDLQKQYEKLNSTIKDFSKNDNIMKNSTKGLNEHDNSLKKVVENQNNYIKNTKNSISATEKFIKNIISLSTATLVFAGIKEGISLIVDKITELATVAGTFEKYRMIIDGLEGSSIKGEASFNRILEMAKVLPQTLDEVTESFIKLKGQGLDNSNDVLRTYADAALAMGKPMVQGIEMMADAVTGEFERLKEYGITAQATGTKTVLNWVDTTGKAKYIIANNSKEIQSSILSIFSSKFAGQTLKFQQSFDGIKANLISTNDIFKTELAKQSGIFDKYKDGMASISNELDNFMKDKDKFAIFSESVGQTAKSTVDGLLVLAKTMTYVYEGLSIGFNGFQNLVLVIYRFIAKIWNAISDFSYEMVDKMQKRFRYFFQDIIDSYNTVVSAFDKELVIKVNLKSLNNLDRQLQTDKLNNRIDINPIDAAITGNWDDMLSGITIAETLKTSIDQVKNKINETNDVKLNSVKEEFSKLDVSLSSSKELLTKLSEEGFNGELFVSKIMTADKKTIELFNNIRKTKKDFMKDIKEGDIFPQEQLDNELKNNMEIINSYYNNYKDTVIKGEKEIGTEGDKLAASAFLKRQDNLISYYKEIGNLTEAHYLEINKIADENNKSGAYTLEENNNILLSKHNKFLKEQEEAQIDYAMKSLDEYIKYYEAIGDLQTTAQLKIAKGNMEIIKSTGFKVDSPEYKSIETDNTKKANKEAKDARDAQLKEAIDNRNKLLDNEIMYYKAINDLASANASEVEKYKNELREKGFIEGSEKFKSLVLSKEQELNDELTKKRQDEKDELFKINNEKLTFLEDYYKTVGDLENEYAIKKQKTDLAASQMTFDNNKDKQAYINAKNENIEREKQIALLEKQRFMQEELGQVELLHATEMSIYKQELLNKGYQQAEVDLMVAEKEKEYMETFRKDITDKMSMYDAFQAKLYNIQKDFEDKIKTSGELVAEATQTITDKMQSGLETFFDATSEQFLDFKALTKNVIKDILNDLAKMIAKQQAAAVMSAIMGGGGITASANGNAFNNGSVTAFANGGAFTNTIASSPTIAPMALFGEAGPEAIMPLKRDSSGKLGVAANISGGGSTSVVNIIINNNASNKVSVSEKTDTNGNKILTIDEIDAQLSQRMRTGGSKITAVMENKYKSLR